jgi:hypothetical protein
LCSRQSLQNSQSPYCNARRKRLGGSDLPPPGMRARSAARASPRLLGIASAACFGAPLGLACVPQFACTSQVLVCLLRAPPTGGTHSASRTIKDLRFGTSALSRPTRTTASWYIHVLHGISMCSWTGHKSGSGFSDQLLQYCITIGSETTFLSALCVIRCPSYFVWSRTFLLGVGLADLGDFGWYFGQNKEIVSVFNGSVVYFNVGIGLPFLGRCCSTCRQELYFQLFKKNFGR